MENSTTKRIGSFLLALFYVWSLPALASTATCTTTSSTDSVLSVIDDGTITIGAGGCNVQFYGVSTVGTKAGNYTEPEAGSCNEYASDGSVVSTISSSGVSQSARTLDDWEESTSDFAMQVANTSQLAYGTYSASSGYMSYTGSINTNSNGSYTLTVNGTSVVVTRSGSSSYTYTLPGGNYGYIEVDNGTSVAFTGPVRIKKLVVSNNGSVTFAPDNSSATPSKTWIDEFNLSSATRVILSGTTLTTLNILGKNSVTGTVSGFSIGSQVCINYTKSGSTTNECDSSSTKTYAEMAAQHAELLAINIYNGDLTTQGSFAIAANIYVANGAANFSNGTPVTIVGEVLAQSISLQNNAGTQLFYSDTSSTSLVAGSYSLTPPASDSVITTGSHIYRAMQRDYEEDNATAGTSGHLMRFALKSDTTQETTADWDAATLMTTADREAKIYTDSDNKFVLLTQADGSILTDGTNTATVTCIINPDCNSGANLAGRDPDSLVGTPWRTYPILVGDAELNSSGSTNAGYKAGSVLFATDDGILYSVDRDKGTLNWGWIPAQIVPLTAAPANLILKHPWGQISTISLYETDDDGSLTEHTYVMGTALGGQLHFTIETDNYGQSLKSIVWEDYRSGLYSPGSDSWGGITGRPYGGAAPAAQVNGTGKVAYVVNNQLVTRQVNDSKTSPDTYSFAWHSSDRTSGAPAWDSTQVSSNLIYMGDSAIYFGGSNGRVWQSTSEGHLKSGAVNIDLDLDGTEAITFLNGATTSSTSGNGLYLLAQSTSRVTTLKYINSTWAYNWYTSVGASSSSTVPYIPSDNSAYISAPSDISNSSVYLYYTTTDSTGCDIEGYEFGPISLADGSSKLSSLTVGSSSSLSSYIGPGEAVGGIVAEWYSSSAGTLYYGVLAATAGTPSSSGSSDSSSSGSSGTSATLTTDAQTLFLGQDGSSSTARVNWRELTNFF